MLPHPLSSALRTRSQFGSEKNGLSNDELACAHGIITIPTFPGFSSLNLAQAVLLMCYEWASATSDDAAIADGIPTDEATATTPTGGRTQLDVAKEAWRAESEAAEGSSARAPVKQLESLFEFWEDALWRSGFFGGGRAVRSAYGAVDGAAQEQSRAAAAMAWSITR